jgi:hypothetical protein
MMPIVISNIWPYMNEAPIVKRRAKTNTTMYPTRALARPKAGMADGRQVKVKRTRMMISFVTTKALLRS